MVTVISTMMAMLISGDWYFQGHNVKSLQIAGSQEVNDDTHISPLASSYG